MPPSRSGSRPDKRQSCGPGGVDMNVRIYLPHEFDVRKFFDAMDARRRSEQLSWSALAVTIWEQSRVLNERRKDHPISPVTLKKLAEGRGVSCQHALFALRWLNVPPESSSPSLSQARPASSFLKPTRRTDCVGACLDSTAIGCRTIGA
jgi:hypothetical protein